MKYPLWMIAVLFSTSALAQATAGKVIYERKMNLHKDMPPEAEQFRAMIPEFQTSRMELLYNSSQSLFHALPNEEEDQMPQPGGDGGPGMNFRFGGMDAETFRDYDKETMVESREMGPKKYLIDDTIKTPKWKLEEDTMTILGYTCHKATTTQQMRMRGPGFAPPGTDTTNRQKPPPPKEQPLIAWYTEAIESQAGPDNVFGLPGLILKTDFNNGSVVYTALSIENSDKTLVKAPTTGKKITREAYRKMMQEQMQNMRGPGGPGDFRPPGQ